VAFVADLQATIRTPVLTRFSRGKRPLSLSDSTCRSQFSAPRPVHARRRGQRTWLALCATRSLRPELAWREASTVAVSGERGDGLLFLTALRQQPLLCKPRRAGAMTWNFTFLTCAAAYFPAPPSLPPDLEVDSTNAADIRTDSDLPTHTTPDAPDAQANKRPSRESWTSAVVLPGAMTTSPGTLTARGSEALSPNGDAARRRGAEQSHGRERWLAPAYGARRYAEPSEVLTDIENRRLVGALRRGRDCDWNGCGNWECSDGKTGGQAAFRNRDMRLHERNPDITAAERDRQPAGRRRRGEHHRPRNGIAAAGILRRQGQVRDRS
jgi:hypothetical protein